MLNSGIKQTNYKINNQKKKKNQFKFKSFLMDTINAYNMDTIKHNWHQVCHDVAI